MGETKLDKVKTSLVKLYAKMADMTMTQCKKRCVKIGSCCSREYCDAAFEDAVEKGWQVPAYTKAYLEGGLMLDETNNCAIPPHIRALCTLHQCDMNSLAFFRDEAGGYDAKSTDAYCKLSRKISKEEYERELLSWKL